MTSPEQSFPVYLVDDDPTARLIATEILNTQGFAVCEFADGAALLTAAETDTPDVILLDIEMPGMDGIDACRALRTAGLRYSQIIFISTHNDLDTRLTAYEAGGNDFIAKPYEPVELARKVEVAQQNAAHRRELLDQAQYAQRTAFSAMSSMAEMGVLLEFLRESFACETVEALADTLFAALRQYDLIGLLALRCSNGQRCLSPRGVCTPIECSILEHASGLERIFQFRNRLVINYPTATLLVHLPADADTERVGRLRDHLAVLVEGATARLAAMETMQRQMAQASGISDAVTELTRTLIEIDQLQVTHRIRATEIDQAYLEELIDAFVHLGLTEAQEMTLSEMAQHTHMQLASLRDESSNVGDHLREVVRKLDRLIGNRTGATA
ncbi:MAG: response regulator [Pseudomonadota bacterium]